MAAVLDNLRSRGLIAQVSDAAAFEAHLAASRRVVYCGFDPTAESLHVGNLVQLLNLRRFQQGGHQPILLVGGATGLIGDPGGKSEERRLNSREQVAAWTSAIREQASRFLDFDGAGAGIVANNLEWTAELDVITFLRDIGKHFAVNAMVQRDSVRSRLQRDGAGISFTEFSYMVLQAMDFLELAKRHGCSAQIGGSDQWGNIVSGVELIRRVLARPAFALTSPLITRADGRKFGKTEGGAIWLDARKTSPYAFHQFWINAADADVAPLLRRFTFLDAAEIDAAAEAHAKQPQRRIGQRLLAEETTRLVHGQDALRSAERIAAALFSGGIDSLTAADCAQLRLDGMACTTISPGAGLLTVLADAGLAASRGAARRLVESRALRVNGRLVEDSRHALRRQDALHGRYHLIRRGRKAWHLALHDP